MNKKSKKFPTIYVEYRKGDWAVLSKILKVKNRDRFIQIGLTISAFRRWRGLTQNQLAEKANISMAHLSNIEAPNLAYSFSLEVLYDIADAIEIDAVDILSFKYPI